MDNREFAIAMIEYEEYYRKLKELEARISEHVMELGSTQAVGNVTAKYSNGRASYDYEHVRLEYPEEKLLPYIREHKTIVEKIDWRSICKDLGYQAPIDKEPVPYVKISVKD